MRDAVLIFHIILGLVLIVAPFFIIAAKKGERWLKPAALITAAASWLLLVPAGILYLTFYPATKTLIKAGSWPWAHAILMETKEHWGLLLPVIATTAALLVQDGRLKESKKWWMLVSILSIILAVMGRIIKIGALQ